MNIKSITIIISLLALISLSYQFSYFIASEDDSNYVVVEAGECIKGIKYVCESKDKAIIMTYDNIGCEGEAIEESEVDCEENDGFCKCSNDLPSGNRLEMFDDKSCEEKMHSLLILNDEDCFSLSFSPIKNNVIEILGDNKYKFYQYSGDNCSGDEIELYEGESDECIIYGQKGIKITLNTPEDDDSEESSGFFLTSSTLIILISFLILLN